MLVLQVSVKTLYNYDRLVSTSGQPGQPGQPGEKGRDAVRVVSQPGESLILSRHLTIAIQFQAHRVPWAVSTPSHLSD